MKEASFALGPMAPAVPNIPGIANFEAEVELLPSEAPVCTPLGVAHGRAARCPAAAPGAEAREQRRVQETRP